MAGNDLAEGVITLGGQSDGDTQSRIESALIKLGYTWLAGLGAVEDNFAMDWVRSPDRKAKYPRFHLKVKGCSREGKNLHVLVQLHLDTARHESPMDGESIRRCQEEIERLESWFDSVPC